MQIVQSRKGETFIIPNPVCCYCCIAYYSNNKTDNTCGSLTASVYVTGAGIDNAQKAGECSLQHFKEKFLNNKLIRVDVLPDGCKRWDNVKPIHTIIVHQ